MEMPEFHRQTLDAALETCHRYGLVLAGGYAVKAHGLVDRPSKDLDLATFSTRPIEEITDALACAYRARGFEVVNVRGNPLFTRLVVTDAVTGSSCAVDLMKMPLQHPPVLMEICPVANLDDLIGMKVAALHGRSEPRDLIDVFSVAERYGFIELERLGSLFDEDFTPEGLILRLQTGVVIDDAEFIAYGLDEEDVTRLRRFLLAWCDDLAMRLAERDHLALGVPEIQRSGYPGA
jgi:predicted nucleotidyltransferase component of viral defense system